jgi:ferritin-like metal-binding protein YciE
MATATDPKETLASWLKDAHAMKVARIQNLERQAERYEDFPELQNKLSEHIVAGRTQVEELEQCLQQLGADTSAFKDAASKVASRLQNWTTSAAPDEVVKNCIANDAFAEFEAASFESLSVAAAQCGESQIADVCARMRDREREAADWFQSEIPRITQSYLAQKSQRA